MQEYLLTFTGIDPFYMHNDRLANPLDPYKQAIAGRTALKKKTDADHWWIARQEWEGGLHFDEQNGHFRVYVPARMPKAALLRSAKMERKGQTLKDAVILMAEDGGLRVPLAFDTPWNGKGAPKTEAALETLWAAEYYDMRMVGVDNTGKRKVLRTRPRFGTPWEIKFAVVLEESIMDFRVFEKIAVRSGRLCGLGEAPEGSRARYDVKIEPIAS